MRVMNIKDIKGSGQYLSFILDTETFAIDITKVREVLDFDTATKIPQTPDFMRGVINLRGSVVPVIDMKLKFSMGETEKGINTCVIIVEVDLEEGGVILGMLADSVQEVFDLSEDQIEKAPSIGSQIKTEFLSGMGKKDDEFVLMLDINRVFSEDELSEIHESQNINSTVEA
jgi:purine-binding chemotaxis protein CheW